MASMLDKLQGEYVKPSDISRKIEVIGSGFGRTGTMSLSAALEKLLRGPVFHSGTIIFQDEKGAEDDSVLSSGSPMYLAG
jgi:hypothetical protein